jgi:hypothetical protein
MAEILIKYQHFYQPKLYRLQTDANFFALNYDKMMYFVQSQYFEDMICDIERIY